MAVLTVVPAEPRATIDACRVEVTEADPTRGPDETGGPFRYRVTTERPSGSEIDKPLISHEFTTSKDGEHIWMPVVFDEAGTWTLNLIDTDDDSVVETTELEVT